MKQVRIVLAGYGRFGRHHASVLASHPASKIVAITDPDMTRRKAAESEHPGAAIYNDPFDMIEDVEADAISIVSPESTHAEISRAAIQAKLQVFCEKPMATDIQEARQLLALAREKDVHYRIGYILRYEPRHRLLKEQVAAGTFGRIAVIRAKRDVSRAWFEAYGHRVHPVYETLVHDIDLVIWIGDQRCTAVTSWERHFTGFDTPETLVVVLELDGGTLATLETAWLAPSGAPANITGWDSTDESGDGVIDASLEVVGTDGSAFLSTYEPSLTFTTPRRTYIPDLAFWPELGGTTMGALREELWDFVNVVAGRSGAGVDSIDDALHVQEIASAAVEAATTNSRVVL